MDFNESILEIILIHLILLSHDLIQGPEQINFFLNCSQKRYLHNKNKIGFHRSRQSNLCGAEGGILYMYN